MRIQCPFCARDVVGASVSLRSRLATCIACNTVFDISEQLIAKNGAAADSPHSTRRRQERRDPVRLPEGFRIEREPEVASRPGQPYRSPGRVRDALTIEWRWFHKKHWFLFGITGLWLVFLIVWYSVAVLKDDQFMMWFAVVHLIAGLGLLYLSIAMVKNRTAVSVRGEVLEVHHGPLPWSGNKRLSVRELSQFYCKKEVAYRATNRPIMMYSLHARLRQGGAIKLSGHLNEPEQALFLEQQLEDCLGIIDVAVPGELAKPIQEDVPPTWNG
ncbi:MAG: hypothetical protein MJE77_12500 [Proteobacteria bacterium]|nr:hypothetical protein [Pseudomonadota bacterium]